MENGNRKYVEPSHITRDGGGEIIDLDVFRTRTQAHDTGEALRPVNTGMTAVVAAIERDAQAAEAARLKKLVEMQNAPTIPQRSKLANAPSVDQPATHDRGNGNAYAPTSSQ
jgi:hypothetical protein